LSYLVVYNTSLEFSISLSYNTNIMKQNIHPKYYENARAQCACGNAFTVGSTKEFLEVEICSACHPFYTGKEKIMDTMGQVQKFRKRLAKKEELEAKRKKRSR